MNLTLRRWLKPWAPDSLIRSKQPEVAESLFNRRDLVWWAGILLGCGPWRGEAELLFAVQKPRALGHEAVLARDPFLDFLVGGALMCCLLLAGMARRAVTSSIVIASAHFAGRGELI